MSMLPRPPLRSCGNPRIDMGGLVLGLPLYRPDMAGSTIISEDSYAHSCTVTEATWGSQGRTFDGVNDYISVPDSAILDITGNVTVEIWMKATEARDYANLLARAGSSASSSNPFFLSLTGASETARFYITKTNGVAGDGVTNWASMALNTWHHIVGVSDSTKVYCYVDTVVASIDRTQDSMFVTDQAMKIGRGSVDAESFKGLIGEVRIYNRALSVVEVQHNYRATQWRYQ